MLSSARLKAWQCPRSTSRGTPNDMRLLDHGAIEWVRGTAIGIATSPSGVNRTCQGTVSFPKNCARITAWASEL